MAGASSGKGGVADATLNVVPTIDLLVCLICFLLVSTVWTALTRIDTEQVLPKRAGAGQKSEAEKPATIQIAVTAAGYEVNATEAEDALKVPSVVPVLAGKARICRGRRLADGRCSGAVDELTRYDREGLAVALEKLVAQLPQKHKTRVMVMCADEVAYVHMIGAMDTALSVCEPGTTDCLQQISVGDIGLFQR